MTKDRLNWIIKGLNWEQLTDWEEGFVQSIEEYFGKYGHLTSRQEEIFERIYKQKAR